MLDKPGVVTTHRQAAIGRATHAALATVVDTNAVAAIAIR